jgi:hypothetical protein
MPNPSPPVVEYWHLWTDDHGVSRQTRRKMTHFEFESISPPAHPQWQGRKSSGDATVFVTVLPIGWIGDWHENPKPQWIIPLSGRWFVESMDGQHVEMGAGELSFGGDQNTVGKRGSTGHRSGAVGDQAAVLIIIQFNDDRTRPFLGAS